MGSMAVWTLKGGIGQISDRNGKQGNEPSERSQAGVLLSKINIFVITSSNSSPTFEKSYQLLHADSEHLFRTVDELEEAESR
jgi:hypothetical protein